MAFSRLSSLFRRLFPAALTHIPSEADMERHDERIAQSAVMQHAEGSVLLGEGKFEIKEDLLENDLQQAGALGQ